LVGLEQAGVVLRETNVTGALVAPVFFSVAASGRPARPALPRLAALNDATGDVRAITPLRAIFDLRDVRVGGAVRVAAVNASYGGSEFSGDDVVADERLAIENDSLGH